MGGLRSRRPHDSAKQTDKKRGPLWAPAPLLSPFPPRMTSLASEEGLVLCHPSCAHRRSRHAVNFLLNSSSADHTLQAGSWPGWSNDLWIWRSLRTTDPSAHRWIQMKAQSCSGSLDAATGFLHYRSSWRLGALPKEYSYVPSEAASGTQNVAPQGGVRVGWLWSWSAHS